MKKIAIVLAMLVLGGSMLSSCKSHERCPAYGKLEKPAKQKTAVQS